MSRQLGTESTQLFDGKTFNCYSVRPMKVIDLFDRTVEQYPERIAIVSPDDSITYAELRGEVAGFAQVLRNYGVETGHRVAVFAGNETESMIALLAITLIGAITVPLSKRYRRTELGHAFEVTRPMLIIAQDDLQQHLPPVDDATRIIGFQEVRGQIVGTQPSQSSLVCESDPFVILFTSGTTGQPKGAVLSQVGAIHAALSFTRGWGLEFGSRSILAAPWSHSIGIGLILSMLDVCGTLVLQRDFKADRFLELMETHRVTYTALAPAMYALCSMAPGFVERDLSSWKVAGFGGSPMPENVLATMTEAYPTVDMVSCYGATETSGVGIQSRVTDTSNESGAAGKPVEFCEIVVTDEDGNTLPFGEIGEIRFKGPNVVLGYWVDGPQKNDSFVGDWWKSGDLGYFDESGNLYVVDRLKDMISRGGLKVFSSEVENVLSMHPDIEECAIVGVTDDVLGERVHVFIKSPDSVSLKLSSLNAWAAGRLADYKIPESMTLVEGDLPRNPSGKILKNVLKDSLK